MNIHEGMTLINSASGKYRVTLVRDGLVRYQHLDSGVDVQHSTEILLADIASGKFAVTPEFDEAQASASVPVTAVVTYPYTLAVRDRMILRAYMTKATTGMDLTGAFRATIKGFNDTYRARCKSWAQVAQCAYWLLEGK